MTEAQWLSESDPVEMLLGQPIAAAAPRKFSLFGIATCRMLISNLDESAHTSLATAEQNEQTDWQDLSLHDQFERTLQRHSIGLLALQLLQRNGTYGGPDDRAIHLRAAELVRDIFGNPFRPVAVQLDWLSPQVVALAERIYHHESFDQLPSLASALEAAGCRASSLLNHCRSPGEHVRGCWVVDLLLGNSQCLTPDDIQP